MGKETTQAGERKLTNCASRIGPGMVLLKAKTCMRHPPTRARFRLLTSADRSGCAVKEEGAQLGGESREKGQSRVHLPTKGLIQIGVGHQTGAVTARGGLAPAVRNLRGTGVQPLHIRPENQAQ